MTSTAIWRSSRVVLFLSEEGLIKHLLYMTYMTACVYIYIYILYIYTVDCKGLKCGNFVKLPLHLAQSDSILSLNDRMTTSIHSWALDALQRAVTMRARNVLKQLFTQATESKHFAHPHRASEWPHSSANYCGESQCSRTWSNRCVWTSGFFMRLDLMTFWYLLKNDSVLRMCLLLTNLPNGLKPGVVHCTGCWHCKS